MISLFTLNLWCYYDFDKRFLNIVDTIKNKKPDVIFLQETQIDKAFSAFSQVEQFQKELPEYKYALHSTIYLKEIQRGEKLEKPIQHGMSIISKYPILNTFEYYLPKNEGELEPRSILCFDFEKDGNIYKCANIHFGNKEEWAKNHLEEFLKFIESRNEKRIMVGDFNLYDLSKYTRESSLLQGYKLSYDFKNYISYTKKNWCLDYALIPEEFKFNSLEVLEEYLSDHKGIYLEVSI